MEVCLKQEIINIVTDANTGTTKIGLVSGLYVVFDNEMRRTDLSQEDVWLLGETMWTLFCWSDQHDLSQEDVLQNKFL